MVHQDALDKAASGDPRTYVKTALSKAGAVMLKGPKGEKRSADVVGAAVKTMKVHLRKLTTCSCVSVE